MVIRYVDTLDLSTVGFDSALIAVFDIQASGTPLAVALGWMPREQRYAYTIFDGDNNRLRVGLADALRPIDLRGVIKGSADGTDLSLVFTPKSKDYALNPRTIVNNFVLHVAVGDF